MKIESGLRKVSCKPSEFLLSELCLPSMRSLPKMEGVVLGVVLLYDTGYSPKSTQPDHAPGERLEHSQQYIYFNGMFFSKNDNCFRIWVKETLFVVLHSMVVICI